MKNILSFILPIFLLLSCVDPCKDLVCLNGGTCLDGACLCPDFYIGTDCGIEERSNYFATYTGMTTYTDNLGNTNTYADSKTISSSSKGVSYIKFDGGVYASLSTPGAGVFDIPSQSGSNPAVSDTYYSGSGSFSGDYVNYTITVENNGQILTMSFTGSK